MAEGIILRMTDIGHLLGSAAIELWLTEGDLTKKIVFSGDVGNINQPLLRDPQPVEEADYLVIESTYGDRLHEQERRDVAQELAGYIQQALDQGGNLVIPSFAVGRTQEMLYAIREVIPSFAVGRTQEMLYAIREIKQRNLITGHGDFPVYVDSPLAVEATGIFLQCDHSYFDQETQAVLDAGINPIWFDGLRLSVTSVTSEDSKAINEDRTPKVILSASGMCEAGRIRHHLKHNLWRKESVILFVGYQAENSLGRKLQDGAKSVKLFGEDIAVCATIATLHGTSGHADRDGLLAWLEGFQKKPEMVFINHGEDAACEAFRATLDSLGYYASGHADRDGLLAWLEGFQKKPEMVFINHGEDAACEAFRATLDSLGYYAEAPYSGTEYDLRTGKLTAYTDGVRINREAAFKGSQRARQVYGELLAAAEDLLALIRQRSGKPNKENAKLTGQIRSLAFKGSQRARQVYGELLAAAEDLLALIRQRSGKPNKENAKLTGQIRSLIQKWRE